MKRPDYDDDDWQGGDDGYLYSGYWSLCVLFAYGTGGFWK